MSIVEDEGVSEWFWSEIVGLISLQYLEQLFVKCVCFEERLSDDLFEVGFGLEESALPAETLLHGS